MNDFDNQNALKNQQLQKYLFFSRFTNLNRLHVGASMKIDPFFQLILEQWYKDEKQKIEKFQNLALDGITYNSYSIKHYQ